MTAIPTRLAIKGGTPVRSQMLPYGRQWVDDEDIESVVRVLQSDWLTTGPKVQEFEESFAARVGAKYAVAVSSGTAALHAAAYAAGIGPEDEVVVTPLTFAASANCVAYLGATPVFADVDPTTLLLDPTEVAAHITRRTTAIVAVDYAGQPCDYDALRALASRSDLITIADSCHALGAAYKDRAVGTLADLNVFSLHPVKHITTGEGGIITTNDPELAERMRVFRNHGITSDHRQREQQGSWFYEMTDLGYNYRLSDIQCALGLSQLQKLDRWVARRQEIARQYDSAFANLRGVKPLSVQSYVSHAYHLYVVRLDLTQIHATRAEVFAALRSEGIGVNVHYIPVHLHPFYRKRFGTGPGLCPVAESAYEEIVSLPLFPRMSRDDADDVITAMHKVLNAFAI